MIGEIGYLGQVSKRVGILSAALYNVGTTLGAGLLGLCLGSIGFALRWLLDDLHTLNSPTLLIPVALLSLIGGLNDIGILHLGTVGPIRQLPRSYMYVFGPYKTGFLWGLFVGMSYRTRFGYALYWVLGIWALFAGSPLLGMGVMTLYGFIHGFVILADIVSVAYGKDVGEGLFGQKRTLLFYPMSGVALIALCVLALSQLLRLI